MADHRSHLATTTVRALATATTAATTPPSFASATTKPSRPGGRRGSPTGKASRIGGPPTSRITTAACARGVPLPRLPTPPTPTITERSAQLDRAASESRTAAASQPTRSRKCSASSGQSADSGKCSAHSAHSGQLGPAPRLGGVALAAALAALVSEALVYRNHRVLSAVVQRLATPASIRAIFYEALGRRPGFAHPPDDELAVLSELGGYDSLPYTDIHN